MKNMKRKTISETTTQICEKPDLTVLVDFELYAYVLCPIVWNLLARGARIEIVCTSKILNSVKSQIGTHVNLEFSSLDAMRKRHRWRWHVHRILFTLFTRSDFSYQFSKRRQQINVNDSGIKKWLLRLSKITPKVTNRKINGFLASWSGIGLDNPFPSLKVLVGSLNSCPELLGGRNQIVYTLMESWDHPVKIPNGYRSHCVFAWNEDLGKDWELSQSDSNWLSTYPLKLRFAIESVFKEKWMLRGNVGRARPQCVYAVASTRRFSGPVILSLEDRIIKDLCEATQLAGWDLHIKPRPNGEDGEFSEIVDGYSHVTVGKILSHTDVPANYCLTDDYNRMRFQEVMDAEMVINAFTTFGLDAAAAGIPVLQMDLRDTPGYEDSSVCYDNHHIKKYLLGRRNVFRPSSVCFCDALNELLAGDREIAGAFSKEIRDWLISGDGLGATVDKISEILLEEI